MYTERDLIIHAKNYIDKLADGINPLNDLNVNETDVVQEEKIKTCLRYVSKWLFNYYYCLLDYENKLNSLPTPPPIRSRKKRTKRKNKKTTISIQTPTKSVKDLFPIDISPKFPESSIIKDLAISKNTKKNNSFSSLRMSLETKNDSIKKSCDCCKHYRRGDCVGLKLCDDFEYAPTFTPEETKNWPKEGDATYIKRHTQSRN